MRTSRNDSLPAGIIAVSAFVLGCPSGCSTGGNFPRELALGRYLAKPDPSYSWTVERSMAGSGWTAQIIALTSQTWRSPQEADRTLWQHWLTVVTPNSVSTDTALLFIGGGDNGRKHRGIPEEKLTAIASATGAVVAELAQAPNQPLVFTGDKQPRWEDDLIYHTWTRYLQTGDETWPASLPMVKAAVRAMDTMGALLRSREEGAVKVNRFILAGGWKRGWAACLAAAVDERVAGLIAMVADGMNLKASLKHHLDVYGRLSPALGELERHGILSELGQPASERLLEIEDPFAYRKRLTLPKLFINATGDEFFPPDSSRLYFNDLPGEKALRYVPNAKHNLSGSDALQTVGAYFRLLAAGKPLPAMNWELASNGSLVVRSGEAGAPSPRPSGARLWQATNPAARDFRLDVLGKAWTSSELIEEAPGIYAAQLQPPEKGWTAYFIELTYPTDGPNPLKLTTQVVVTPDTLPFAGKPDA